MKEIKNKNELTPGTKLLWEITGKTALKYGKFCIVEIDKSESTGTYYLKFPERINSTPQYMDFQTIKKYAHIITPEEDPEFFL